MGGAGGNLPLSSSGRFRSRASVYLIVAVAVFLTVVVPLGLAIAALSVRYANGQKALIRSVEQVCILNYRAGKERILQRQFIDCSDFDAKRAELSDRYAGWEYGSRAHIELELRGKPFLAQLDMSRAELQRADQGGKLWIARVDHPRQSIVVMADWTYVLSPVIRTIEFIRVNPGIWAVPLALLVLRLMTNLAFTLHRMILRRRAGGSA